MIIDKFKQQALSKGALEFYERRWEPGAVIESHSHPFALLACVTEGEMWLTMRGETRHLLPGAVFELDAHELHAERYGNAGAAYLVARLS